VEKTTFKVSISDVAHRAKVSISTVSRVLNNNPHVSRKNLAKVEEAIAALKYNPNVSAQRLARGSTNAVGLVMPGYPGIFYSFYAVEIIRGIGHACETLRMDMVFHIASGEAPWNSNAVGGIVFADIIENRRQVEGALETDKPCIVINNIVEDLDVSYIGVDNVAGGKIATDYLMNLGHKRIATVTGNLKVQSGAQRLEGFKKALKRNDIPLREEYLYEGDYSRRCARQAMEKFLSLSEPPTAIFAASDEMALEVMAVAIEKGLRIPHDISVVGFDDNPAALYGPVALTTVRQPLFQMAQDAVKYIHSVIASKKPTTLKNILTPQLIIRESCATSKL